MQNYQLELVLRNDVGQYVTSVAIDIDPFEAQEKGLVGLSPPTSEFDTFDSVVTVIKKRNFRKDWIHSAVQRLGIQLAERMEDGEGWHGERRQEIIQQQNRNRRQIL